MRSSSFFLLFLLFPFQSCWHEGSARFRYCLYQGKLSTKVKTYNFNDNRKLHMTTEIRKAHTEVVYQKIYHQKLPNGEYKQIGKHGYVIRKNDFYALLDSSAHIPDGIVTWYFDKNNEKHYEVYKDGKPVLYTGPLVEGYVP